MSENKIASEISGLCGLLFIFGIIFFFLHGCAMSEISNSITNMRFDNQFPVGIKYRLDNISNGLGEINYTLQEIHKELNIMRKR